MKKIVLLLLPFFFIGCGEMTSTPTKKVESFMASYQTLDEKVIEQLNETAASETKFNEEHQKEYKDIMRRHYQGLTYEIKDEIIDGNEATVVVEIEVTDYSKAMIEAEKYLNDHKEEFNDELGEYDEELFTTYRLNKMKDVTDKVKYTLNLYLTKVDNEWQLNDLTNTDQMKIQGMYQY